MQSKRSPGLLEPFSVVPPVDIRVYKVSPKWLGPVSITLLPVVRRRPHLHLSDQEIYNQIPIMTSTMFSCDLSCHTSLIPEMSMVKEIALQLGLIDMFLLFQSLQSLASLPHPQLLSLTNFSPTSSLNIDSLNLSICSIYICPYVSRCSLLVCQGYWERYICHTKLSGSNLFQITTDPQRSPQSVFFFPTYIFNIK